MKSVLLLIAVVCSVTALPAKNGRIFGVGDLAKSGDFPYVVSITENDRHFCSGFIYSEKWIVTTASCVEEKTASKLKVVVGQVSAIIPDPNEQTLTVYTITPLPQYNSTTKANDIALLRLSANITFDDVNVDFVAYNELAPTLPVVAMGWGATFAGGLESVNLHSGDIGIVAQDSTKTCENPGFSFATMMCASNDAEGATFFIPAGTNNPGSPCKYDEGSPLVQINDDGTNAPVHTVVGILSQTDDLCSELSYSVYIRVSIYYSWLINTAGQQPIRPTSTPGGK